MLDTPTRAIADCQTEPFAAAEADARRVLAADPDQPSALFLYGAAALARGAAAEAVALLQHALARRPAHAETRFALGNAWLRQGDAVRAATLYRTVLAADPAHLGARINLSNALRVLGEAAAAEQEAAAAIMQAPTVAPAHAAHAAALLLAGQPGPAIAAAEQALALDPGLAAAWFVRGTGLAALGRAPQAAIALQQAVARAPDDARAKLNLGNALADLDAPAAAAAQCRAAIALDPLLVEAHASLAFLLTAQGRLEPAVAAAEAAIRLDPDCAAAHWNLGTAALLAGDFARGWEEYEWRRRHPSFAADFRRLPGPVWDGGPLDGRTLLVLAEQGLGDTIQMARFLPRLTALGAQVVLACDARLVALLEQLPGVRPVPRQAALPPYDAWIDQMSLPRRFATRPDSIPAAAGYLFAEPDRVADWRRRLPEGRRVGLVWAGNPGHSNDRRRSLDPTLLAPMLALPGITWISLQVGQAAAAVPSGVLDVSAGLTDFAATAALLATLDLLIAVDTSTAHLAGAMGRPAWVLLPHAPDWRWLLSRPDDTPWYRSMRLFRQKRPGDWPDVVARIAAALV